jgi:glutathione S-transferase
MSDVTLYSYNISPYAAKVRAALAYKGIPFREEMVHPLRRGILKQKSGQILVPILEHDARVVHDSTRILGYLDEAFPEKPILPADPVQRGLAKLLEEWADEGLRTVVQPVRFLIEMNYERTSRRFRSAYPPGRADDLVMAAAMTVTKRHAKRKYGGGNSARYLNRLAEVLDYAEASIGAAGWLVGDQPSVADFALAGWIGLLRGLDGWETVRVRRKVAKLVKTLLPDQEEEDEGKKTASTAKNKEAFDAETQAVIDASRLRRASKGTL